MKNKKVSRIRGIRKRGSEGQFAVLNRMVRAEIYSSNISTRYSQYNSSGCHQFSV
jgi:hypothetical protein